MFERLRGAFSSFIEKVSTEELTEEKIAGISEEFKLSLVENDVAFVMADMLCHDVSEKIRGLKSKRFKDRADIVRGTLAEMLLEILTPKDSVDLLKLSAEKRPQKQPLVAVFVGINGVGKTTTISKIARLLTDSNISVVLACSDTYRPGAIEQLEAHANRLGVKMIRHDYGGDAASVAFDAIAYAKSKGINVVLVDTAGRMETNYNLMEEMKKIVRVTSPDVVFLVADALTGSDAIAQAEEFSKFVPITATVLTKMDADAKGGAAVSIAYVTKRPIMYVGMGQRDTDLKPFNPVEYVEKLLGRLET